MVHVRADLQPTVGVPAPVDSGRAHGSFSATISGSGARRRFVWTILFFDLTGPAVKAALHLGSSDPEGGDLFALCHPCRAGQSGSTVLTPRGLRAIMSGRTFVVVRTAENPRGEIRGRLVAGRRP